MRAAVPVRLCVGLVALLTGCAPAGTGFTAAHRAALEDSVRRQLQSLERLSAEGDSLALSAIYSESDDFRFYEQGRLQYTSAADIRALIAALPPGTRFVTTYRDVQVLPLAPGRAVVNAEFTTDVRDGSGQTQYAFQGASTLVWAHEAAGWRILIGHSSGATPEAGDREGG